MKKSTHIDLPFELRARNKDGKYDHLIDLAERFAFHDYKHMNDFTERDPKIALLKLLRFFPELKDIAIDVLYGVYDEDPDDVDLLVAKSAFLNRGGTEEWFNLLFK